MAEFVMLYSSYVFSLKYAATHAYEFTSVLLIILLKVM